MFSQQKEFNLGVGLVFLMLAISGAVAALPDLVDNSKQSRTLYVEGELLVKAKKGYSISSAKQFISSSGDVVAKQVDNKGLMLVKLSKNDTVKAAMTRYKASSAYEVVQPNFRYYATATVSDADFGELWGLKNTGQTLANPVYGTNNPGTAGNDIDAEKAWDIQTDCSSKVIAVLDTGINYLHSDLTDNKWINPDELEIVNGADDGGNGITDDFYGADFIDNINGEGDPMPTDAEYHGTHVAATIAANGGKNLTGMTGVCQTAKLMSVRVLGSNGGSTATVVAGMNYAVANGAKIINMSLGGGGFDTSFDNAITNAGDNGVVVIVAAGNDGVDTNSSAAYPCNYTQSNLVCVAALDQAYSLASFSNYGSTHVDIGAPGTNIYSAYPSVQESEPLTGWTNATGAPNKWAMTSCTLSSGTVYPMLAYPLPTACDGTGVGYDFGPYIDTQDEITYRNYDFSTYLGASVEYYARVNTTDSNDFFAVGIDNSAGTNPFDSGTGDTVFESLFGNEGADGWYLKSYSLDDCLTATCSIGFRFKSDSTGTNTEGVSLIAMNINRVVAGSTQYTLLNGTSMASPHAAGVAALVYSYNPTYTAAEVATAIKNSGESIASLSGTTTTGKALNAFNALLYIQTPSGVTAVVQ